jgi:protein SCO1/2
MQNTLLTSIALALLLVAGTSATAGDKDPHAEHRAMMHHKVPEPSAEQFSDIDLRNALLYNQDGEEVRFVDDVIGDRIVVMDFVYTTCTTVCPVLTALLTQVQNQLGEDLGNEVAMVSMTVDAARDTPARLKAYATKHRVQPGWVWLTGPKPTMDNVLTGLGAFTVSFEDHPAMVIVGDGRSGEWKRMFGFPNPDRIMKVVNEFRAKREAGS